MSASAPARERFTRDQVRRILRLSERQLINWERQGFLGPPLPSAAASAAEPETRVGETVNGDSGPRTRTTNSGKVRRKPESADRFYTFSDIVALRTLMELRDRGIPPARLRAAHTALKRRLSGIEKPWSELQITGRGKDLIVQVQGRSMEAITGQLLLEYASENAGRNGGAPIRFKRRRAGKRANGRSAEEKRAKAERFFLAGLRFEEKGNAEAEAIRCYQKAIEFNPDASGAYINLGTIYYNLRQLDEAEKSYLAALAIDPNYVLVHFNLGNVADERSDLAKARMHYENAIRRDPFYPDPHYNLAMVYEKLGLHGKARKQWLDYLKLDQTTQWAAHARRQVEKTGLRIVRREYAPAGADRKE